ncbi:MAG TPA: NAD(P)H-dependent oxidoreductase [Chthoniobacteraceae bacterium]|jgi:nitroreductase
MTDTTISSETLLQQLNWRYATKAFDPTRKISAADWQTLEQTLILTPSSYGMQPYKFLVITDTALREKLMPAAWSQRQVVDCSHFVVFARQLTVTAADVEHFIARVAEVRSAAPESLVAYRDVILGDVVTGPRSQMAAEWSARQLYIALGNLMTSAALLGIDVCPMEGFVPAQFDEILGLPAQGLGAVVAAAVGYRSPEDKYAQLTKVRLPASELVTHI